jgi:hypothetical protein
MSDPIAQAAQQISEQQPKEGVVGEIMGAMHALEEKVEHFLHPDAPALAQTALDASQASGALADQVHQQGMAGSIDPALVEQAKQAQAVATDAALAVANAPAVAQPGEPPASTSQPAADTTEKSSEQQGTGEAGNVVAVETASSPSEKSLTMPSELPPPLAQSKESIPPTSGESLPQASAGASGLVDDSPNAAPAADAKPATQPSVQGVSTPAGMPTTGVSLPANGIRASLQAIRNHLRIRGFEQSAVADIHKELEAIERWL